MITSVHDDGVTRRVPSSAGNPVRSAERIASALIDAPDGATLSFDGTPYRGDGILVAARGFDRRIGRTPTVAEVADWVREVAPVVTSAARFHFGAWRNNGALYLDVAELFSSADEDAAMAAMDARREVAAWHNGRREVILYP
jgi:hypothetical protein